MPSRALAVCISFLVALVASSADGDDEAPKCWSDKATVTIYLDEACTDVVTTRALEVGKCESIEFMSRGEIGEVVPLEVIRGIQPFQPLFGADTQFSDLELNEAGVCEEIMKADGTTSIRTIDPKLETSACRHFELYTEYDDYNSEGIIVHNYWDQYRFVEEECPAGDEKCFPSGAMVIKADGTTSRVDGLKEGDEIVALTAEGALTTDTVSLLSIAQPKMRASSYAVISTAANHSLTLTAGHHLPVGGKCCSTLKQAENINIGETVWTVAGGAVTYTTVTMVSKVEAKGLHSPVLTNGGFPVVDGVVTAFDTIEKVTLAKYGLAPLLQACKAVGGCDAFRRTFMGEDREYIAA
jgi:hypothetical protein